MDEFKARLVELMHLGKTSLEIKRKIIEDQTDKGLYPYSAHYLRDVKQRTGHLWYNHFNTIGIVGMNEALLNFMGKSIADARRPGLSQGHHAIHARPPEEIQEETGHVYNLEATPAEGTGYRLARIGQEALPRTSSPPAMRPPTTPTPRSCPWAYGRHLRDARPAGRPAGRYTPAARCCTCTWARRSMTPTCARPHQAASSADTNCPTCPSRPRSRSATSTAISAASILPCPSCGGETEVWSRVTGYLRPVQNFNDGKRQEYFQRRKFTLPEVLA